MARLRSRLRLGVRGKLLALLAGTALLALLLACASFVYYDRTSTAAAKQRTIGVLTRSVAQSAFGPTAFGDPDSARVILEVLAAEPTARAGAIYGTDGARLASWERSPRDALPTARPTLADGIHGGRLAVTRAITGPDGDVGTLVVVVSTSDLDVRTQRFLALATAVLVVALLVAVVIAMVGQRFVTRPVRTLADAARAVQRDGNFDVRAARTSDDELGQLTDAFNAMLAMIQARDHELAGHRQNLEQLVARRTADLDRRNGQMRLVLDHVAQGLLTIDLHGRVAAERSAIVDRWFPELAAEASLATLLRAGCPRFAEWLELGLGELREDIMPPELVLSQLPTQLTWHDRVLACEYTSIGGGDGDEGRLLVIMTDVTEAQARREAEAAQTELAEFFQRVARDRGAVEDFFRESATLLMALREETDPLVQRRLVHTIKGGSATLGLRTFAAHAHTLESALGERTDGGVTAAELDTLVMAWKGVIQRFGALLGGNRDRIEVDRAAYQALLDRPELPPTLRAELAGWVLEPVARSFARLGEQVVTLAERLGRATPTIEIDAAGIRLPGPRWRGFWAAMVHLVRNAVDHGLAPAADRVAAGKPAAGIIRFRAARAAGALTLTVSDDGVGVDWDALAARAAARGLPVTTDADLIAALFADGVSTSTTVSETSGRGVGMSALHQATLALGGTIAVTSTRGAGTTFTFRFEGSTGDAPNVRQPIRTSLIPVMA